jgi:hypothetical protein
MLFLGISALVACGQGQPGLSVFAEVQIQQVASLIRLPKSHHSYCPQPCVRALERPNRLFPIISDPVEKFKKRLSRSTITFIIDQKEVEGGTLLCTQGASLL